MSSSTPDRPASGPPPLGFLPPQHEPEPTSWPDPPRPALTPGAMGAAATWSVPLAGDAVIVALTRAVHGVHDLLVIGVEDGEMRVGRRTTLHLGAEWMNLHLDPLPDGWTRIRARSRSYGAAIDGGMGDLRAVLLALDRELRTIRHS